MTNSDATAASACPSCGAPLKRTSGRGRPRKFCSAGCKRTAELKVRRLNEHIARLELEAEHCRRMRLPYMDTNGASPEQRAQDVARELATYEDQLRNLLSAIEGEDARASVPRGAEREQAADGP